MCVYVCGVCVRVWCVCVCVCVCTCVVCVPTCVVCGMHVRACGNSANSAKYPLLQTNFFLLDGSGYRLAITPLN